MGFFGFGSVSKTKCKECGTELPDPQRLKRHQEIAHKKMKEKCRACGSEFYTKEQLTKHKKKCK